MSIAHVVFDLPLEGPFDYSIPEQLSSKAVLGARVKVMLATKAMSGFIVAVAREAQVAKTIKPIKSVTGRNFDARDLAFAKAFAAYHGCSLGEALGTITRHRSFSPNTADILSKPAGSSHIYHVPDGNYVPVIGKLTDGRQDHAIIVPDSAVANSLGLPVAQRPFIGLRSSMFEAFAHKKLLVVVDEDNPSYKQEQSPMYETRQVVLMAQAVYGFDAAFISTSPSVELMHLAGEGMPYTQMPGAALARASVIDLGQYKYLDKGILSPPVRNALEANIKSGLKSLVILNRRGTYGVTRCVDCSHILKCPRCDAPMGQGRGQKHLVCRICARQEDRVPNCPQCGKMHWKSFGMGVEQLQKELCALFPTARIAHFDKDSKELPAGFDILIATQAVLRFRHKLAFQTVVLADIDGELNRADMRSSCKAWALACRMRLMGGQMLVQTRNRDHHMLKALSAHNDRSFYDAEFALRKELGFPPFAHWAAVTARAKMERSAESFAQDVYNQLSRAEHEGITITAPEPDVPAKVRDQYRFRVLLQGNNVEELAAAVKAGLTQVKRRSGALVTLNIDP